MSDESFNLLYVYINYFLTFIMFFEHKLRDYILFKINVYNLLILYEYIILLYYTYYMNQLHIYILNVNQITNCLKLDYHVQNSWKSIQLKNMK